MSHRRHCCEHSNLFKHQLFQAFAEIVLGGRLEAIIAMSQGHLVAVKSQNLGLGVKALDLDGKKQLLELSLETFLRIQEAKTTELLCQSAGSLNTFSRKQTLENCPSDPGHVDAPMPFKILVLGDNEGILEDRGNLLVGNDNAALQRK